MPSRRRKKSAAQTPAPKAEQIYGSKKNPAGSADTGKSVTLSSKTINTLKDKLSDFKKNYPSKKNISVNDLKAVYRRGSGAYSKSHRPTITGGKPNSRAAWSFARVNKFLQKAAGKKVKAAYVQDDDLLKSDGGVLYAEGGKTFNDKELLEKYNAGESIGFTATAHLKAKGLIERADGTKRKSDKYLDGGDIDNLLLEEGKKYFLKLQEIDGRYFLNYPKNKGSFSESGFKNHLVAYKIEKVIDWLNAKNITYSNSSQSVYFTLNGKNFRISDHKKSFDGIDITIKWNTPIEDIMQNKTLYHGSPYEFTEFSELNIGTGEGNQKYGRGFYFTESPEVAERYSLVPSDNSFYINAVKLKDDSSLSDNDKLTILSIWRQKWEEGYSETKEDYISEILDELQKSSLGISKEQLTQQFGEDLFTEEEFAELNAETYKRLCEYLASANLEIKSYIYEIKLITNNLYFAEDEMEEADDESYDGLYYNYPYQDGIKNYVIFSSKNFYIISKKNFKMGGNINQQIECVGCGWKWDTADSDSSDMYVCHQCGFDNSLFYETANVLKPTLSKGGVVVGKRHSEMDENGETGEKFIVKSTGQVVELEGGEGVLCKESMNSDKKYIFEGKKMTGKEIASFLNHKYGGVEFAKGGKIDYACACKSRYYHGGELPSAKLDSLVGGEAVVTVKTMESKDKYHFGSKMMTPRQILSKINAEYSGKKFDEGGTIDFSDMDLQIDKQITKMVFFTEKILYL